MLMLRYVPGRLLQAAPFLFKALSCCRLVALHTGGDTPHNLAGDPQFEHFGPITHVFSNNAVLGSSP
jgi:hypothetical protein